MTAGPLTPELLDKMDAYWRAANYLSVAQIYLLDNPLLKRPLMLADVKHMLLGHWGTTPGQNFIYVHLNSPKGWTGPKWVDGLPIEGSFRAHQVPIAVDADHPEHLQLLEDWLKSYRPEELFDGQGRLRPELAELKIRVVNVVDLFKLETPSEHAHGLSDADFDALFTTNKPVIFAFHGYPWLIHRLTYRRTNHANFHVRGYKEEGTITTPFDMRVLNDLDRFHLVRTRSTACRRSAPLAST